jgi:uncharacterized protein YbbC (DUF1343 family)
MTGSAQITIGASRLAADPSLLPGENSSLGLLTNYTGTMPDLGRNIDALRDAGLRLTALFSPEHGLWGSAQAGDSEPGGIDETTRLPIYDTYRKSGPELDALLAESGVSRVLVDLADLGLRFYTYIWSVFDLMLSAARLGIAVTVLDRPNPLSGLPAQGPGLDPSCSSFVGRVSIPIIHGLTLGELSRHFNATEIAERAGAQVDLSVITVQDWDRHAPVLSQTEPWVPPSPNIPTAQSALVYAGSCLFEGTNASEGRGTTHPFESIGAGYVDGRYAAALRELQLPGVMFRDQYVVPTFSKWQGVRIRGVQLHVTDPQTYQPLHTAVTMLQLMASLYPDDFAFLEARSPERPPAIDLLWGSDVLRRSTADPLDQLIAASPAPRTSDEDISLYA